MSPPSSPHLSSHGLLTPSRFSVRLKRARMSGALAVDGERISGECSSPPLPSARRDKLHPRLLAAVRGGSGPSSAAGCTGGCGGVPAVLGRGAGLSGAACLSVVVARKASSRLTGGSGEGAAVSNSSLHAVARCPPPRAQHCRPRCPDPEWCAPRRGALCVVITRAWAAFLSVASQPVLASTLRRPSLPRLQ